MRKTIEYIGQFGLAFVACFAVLVVASEALPEHAEQPVVSCAGKHNCTTARFDMDGDGRRIARCVLWGERKSVCVVDPEVVE